MAIASATKLSCCMTSSEFLLISLLQGVFCCRCFACCFVYRFHHEKHPRLVQVKFLWRCLLMPIAAATAVAARLYASVAACAWAAACCAATTGRQNPIMS